MSRIRLCIILAVTAIAVLGCTSEKSKVRAVVSPCIGYTTVSLDKVLSGATADQVESETTPKPPQPDQQVCDESVALEGSTFTCTDIVNSYGLSVVDGGPGFAGPVRIETFEDRARIVWDAAAGHVLIVNGTQLAYLDGPGLDPKGKTVPTSTVLYYSDWGNLVSLDVCGWKR